METMDLEGYSSANTMDQLGHYFANRISNYRLLRQMGRANEDMATQHRDGFISGIESTMRGLENGEIKEQGGIGVKQLGEILTTAKEVDWSQATGLKELHIVFGRITQNEFPEEFLKNIV